MHRLRSYPRGGVGRAGPRKAVATEVIGPALAAEATGSGSRRIVKDLGRSASTVRRWLGRVSQTHTQWLEDQAAQHAFRLDPGLLVGPKQWPATLGWGLNMLAGAALAYQRVLDSDVPLWTLIALHQCLQRRRPAALGHRRAAAPDAGHCRRSPLSCSQARS